MYEIVNNFYKVSFQIGSWNLLFGIPQPIFVNQ